jgi:hypothetical protein
MYVMRSVCALSAMHSSLSEYWMALHTLAGTFKTFVLREGTTIICAGTVRTFGTLMAELPFVGTREGYRCAMLPLVG